MAKAALHFNREIKSSHKPKLSGLYYPLPQLVSKYVENCNLKSLIENEALHWAVYSDVLREEGFGYHDILGDPQSTVVVCGIDIYLVQIDSYQKTDKNQQKRTQ